MPPLSSGVYRLLAAGWTLAIVAGLSIPGHDLPVLDVLSVDKLLHVAAFAVWGLLWLRAYPHAVARVVAAGLLFAVLSEAYQHVMPIGRTFSLYDALADVVGLAVALGLGALWPRSSAQPA